MSLSRRQFLFRSGAAAGGLIVLTSCSLVPVLPTFASPEGDDALAWVQLTENGRIKFFCPRAEMGQGIFGSFAQVVAQEFNLPIDAIEAVYPDTSQIAPAKMTVGSESVEAFARPLAKAAATLRETLRERAMIQSGCKPEQVALTNNGFDCGGQLVSFVDLVAGKPLEIIEFDPAQKLELLSERIPEESGAAASQHFARDIVTGSEKYSRDSWHEDMTFGAIARPPWLGAELKSYDRVSAAATPGVVAVVDGPEGEVGVVGVTPMATRAGIAALNCQWQVLSEEERARIDELNDVDHVAANNDFEHTPVNTGDLDSVSSNARASINVRYDSPMAAHASMEPRAGFARFVEGRCLVDTGSQDPWYVRGAVARAVNLPKENVLVQNHRLGGGFGGRIHCQASVEAAWLAKAVNKPVKVQWSREEEFNFNYAGPGFSHRIKAGVDQSGKINHWHHQMVGSPILTTSALIPANLHWAADLVPDPGTWRGAETSYRIENHRVDFSDIRRPMATGAWRGLGAAPNTFAVECAIDELALAADIDPIEFRILNSLDARLVNVLEALKTMLGEVGDDYRGIAAGAYKGVTFVAVAADVSPSGELKKLWCAHDCGRMINPDRVKAQVEGCLVWGIGMAKMEAFVVENGIGATDNFHRYQVPRMTDVPEIEINLLSSDEASSGAGEAAFPPATAAIVNAMARAQDRQRSLPLR